MFSTHRMRPAAPHMAALFCALSLGIAGSAAAQSAPAPGKGSDQEAFASADKDRDKALSPYEARRMTTIAPQFAKFDVNKDGFMSFEEYVAAMKGGKPAAPAPAKK
jgi:EF hand